MDTNSLPSLPQVAQAGQSALSAIVQAATAIAVLVGILGRWYHAWRTGNPVVSALVKGTNNPTP